MAMLPVFDGVVERGGVTASFRRICARFLSSLSTRSAWPL